MPEVRPSIGAAGFYVFRRVGEDRWQLIGEVARRPGLTARKARDAAGGEPGAGEVYAAVLRSEWRIAREY